MSFYENEGINQGTGEKVKLAVFLEDFKLCCVFGDECFIPEIIKMMLFNNKAINK